MRLIAASGLLLLALALPAPAGAQPPGPGGDPERKSDKDRMRQQIFDQFRAFRMWKMTEELKLDEATAAKLFPLLSKYDEQERELGRDRAHAYREMRQLLEAPNPDPARLDALVERMIALRARRDVLEREKIAAIRKVLSPVQMARLVMLMPRIEEDFRVKIRDAIDTARGDHKGRPEGRSEGRHRFRYDAPLIP